MLGNGDHLPPDPLSQAWKVWVDEFYTNNPHLLPSLVKSGHHNPPPHIQTNFAANFMEVAQSEPVEHKEVMSANSLHLETIMEVTDEDKLVPVIDPDEVPDEEYEPGHIDWLVEVLQASAKDIKNSKKKAGPPHQTPAKSIQSDENQPLQPSLPVPKVVVPPNLHLPNHFHWLHPCLYQP